MKELILVWTGTLTGVVLNSVNDWLAFGSSSAAIIYTLLKIRNELKNKNDERTK
jgi:hypothetical protein